MISFLSSLIIHNQQQLTQKCSNCFLHFLLDHRAFFYQKLLQFWINVRRFPIQNCPGSNLWVHALSWRIYCTHVLLHWCVSLYYDSLGHKTLNGVNLSGPRIISEWVVVGCVWWRNPKKLVIWLSPHDLSAQDDFMRKRFLNRKLNEMYKPCPLDESGLSLEETTQPDEQDYLLKSLPDRFIG